MRQIGRGMTVAHKSTASLSCIDVIILTVRYAFMCNILANYFAAYGKKNRVN